MFSSSDHWVITFNIQKNKSRVKESKEKVPDYQRANYRKLRNIIAQNDWSELSGNISINEAWLIFTSNLNKAVNASVPLRNRRSIMNSKPKWWNTEIKNSLLAKKRAFQKYKLTQLNSDKIEHDRLRRNTKALIKKK